MTAAAIDPRVFYPLSDLHDRRAVDLRVSLTDRCNLRCTYCMPAAGMEWLPKEAVLTAAEIVRLVRVGVELCGITEVRLTGGEPLVRPEAVEIVTEIANLTPRPEISVTTNGILLGRHAPSSTGARRSLSSGPPRFGVVRHCTLRGRSLPRSDHGGDTGAAQGGVVELSLDRTTRPSVAMRHLPQQAQPVGQVARDRRLEPVVGQPLLRPVKAIPPILQLIAQSARSLYPSREAAIAKESE